METETLNTANKIKEAITDLKNLKEAITGNKGNAFGYFKNFSSMNYGGWIIKDKELHNDMSDFIVKKCEDRINVLQNEFDKL